MNDVLDAIILSQSDYKENDALIKTLSDQKGLITFIAKGLLKSESKNASACLPYTESTLSYDDKEGSSLQILHSASIISTHRALREDLSKQAVMAVISELTEQLLKENADLALIKDVVKVYRMALQTVETTDKYHHVIAYFLVSALSWLGVEPQVDECTLCGDSQINSISMEEGGFVCVNCQKEIQSPLFTTEFLYAFRVVNKVNSENFGRFLNYTAPDKTLIEFLYNFMTYHSNISLKSWVFLEKWSIIN